MNLERQLLMLLAEMGDRVMSEKVLFNTVNIDPITETAVTLTELRGALTRLESKGHVVSVKDEDRGTCWKITANGKARIA